MMIEITPELAEICGIHAGDGYLRLRERNKGEVDISGDLEEKEYYDNNVIPLFNKVFCLDIKGRNFSRGTYGFVTYQKKVRDSLVSLGFPGGKKSKLVKVPELIIKNNNDEIYCAFLRGLFDTDGHLGFRKMYGKYSIFKTKYHHYPTINLTTVSNYLFEDVCFMLSKLGIEYFSTNYQPKKIGESKKYIIVINGVNRLNKWIDLIGSKNPVKYSRYLIWKRFGFCPTNTTLKEREDILKDKLDIYSIGL